MSVLMGSGGGGGGTQQSYDLGAAGGGGAGGGSVVLQSEGNIIINGDLSTRGGGGGRGGTYWEDGYGNPGGSGGGGGGGGILLIGQNVTINGVLDARGRLGDNLSINNSGTIKVFYNGEFANYGNIWTSRLYTSGRPQMQGLVSPENDAATLINVSFSWKDAKDPEGDNVLFNLQVARWPTFTESAIVLNITNLTATVYSSNSVLLGGTYYWRVRARDAVGYGNWSETRQFHTDITPPVTHVERLPEFVNLTAFPVTWSGTDDGAGVGWYSIYYSEGKGPFSVWLENTTNTSSVFGLGKEVGRYSFYSLGIDRGGNREARRDKADSCTTVDITPPSSRLNSLTVGDVPGQVVVKWSGEDAISGIRGYDIFVSDDGGTFFIWQCMTSNETAIFTGENGHEYKFYSFASDNAGNYEATPNESKMKKIKVDTNSPVTTLAVGEPNYGQEPTYISQSTGLTLSAVDEISGVKSIFYTLDGAAARVYSNPLKGLATGHHELVYWSVDHSGNNETPREFDFFVDGDAPVSEMKFDGLYSVSGTKAYLTAKTGLILEAVDNASGVARTEYNLDNRGYVVYSKPLGFDSAGTHSLVYRSVDNVGNAESADTITIIVDIQPPVTKASTDELVSKEDIKVKLSANDTESGVNATYFRVVWEKTAAGEYQVGTEIVVVALEDHSADGNYTIQYYSIDKLNNNETVKELKVRIDTQVFLQLGFSGTPKMSVDRFTIDGKTEQGAILTINGEKVSVASDGSFSYAIGLEPGRNKATIVVVDTAGNSMMKPVYIEYDQPVTGTGWFWMVLVGLIVVGGIVGGGLFYRRKRKIEVAAAKARKVKRPIKKGGKGGKR